MNTILFGERYFATRQRLAEVIHGIAELAAHTQTPLDNRLPIAEMAQGLGAPFLFVVCGEVNAGKSSLINGLFGRDLCRVNILPETAQVTWYRYGDPAHDAEVTPLLEERYRPIDFLRDFNLIDTPGINSVVEGHQEITERFLPAADLILFVFPVTNPWGAATWDFIVKLPSETLQRVAFIIQQADQREAIDIKVILGHMADLARKRLNWVPPIFAVSGKRAYEAKRAQPFSKELFIQSGYPELEAYISKNVCESPARKHRLETWRSQASSALRAVEDQIENQTRALSQQTRFLESIEREIDLTRERFVTRLPRHLAGVAEVFETEGNWVTRKLRAKLAIIPSFYRIFVGDQTGPEMEATFIARLQTTVEAVAAKDGLEVSNVCHDHWLTLVARVKETIGIPMGDAAILIETLETAKQRFVQRLGRAARQGVGNLKVRNQLDKELHQRNSVLKSFSFMTLLFIAGAGICGAIGIDWAPWVFGGLATVFFIGGTITARLTQKTITAEFEKRLLDTCGDFASTLRTDYEEALRVIFQDYLTSLGPVRSHLAHEKIAVEPQLKRWQELFLTLKAIEQDL